MKWQNEIMSKICFMIKDILELPEIKNLPSKRFEYGSFVGKVLYLGWYLLIFGNNIAVGTKLLLYV